MKSPEMKIDIYFLQYDGAANTKTNKGSHKTAKRSIQSLGEQQTAEGIPFAVY